MSRRPLFTVEQLERRDVPSSSLPSTPAFFAVGSDVGSAAAAQLMNPDGSVRFTVQPFGEAFTGGVRVAVGDVDGDGTPDLITASGPGGGPVVRVYAGTDGHELGSFQAFEPSYTGGVNLTAADFDRDGKAEIVVTPDRGGGPRVRVVRGADGSATVADFMGIDDPNFRGGVRVAVGDVDGDSIPDLVVGAGYSGGPRVAVFDGVSIVESPTAPQRLMGDFMAFEPGLRDGVYVAAGDVNGDGYADLVLGGGPSGGPRVLVLDGHTLLQSEGSQLNPLQNFFAFDPSLRTGARVATGDANGDGVPDIFVGTGSGGGGSVQVYVGPSYDSAQTFGAAIPGATGSFPAGELVAGQTAANPSGPSGDTADPGTTDTTDRSAQGRRGDRAGPQVVSGTFGGPSAGVFDHVTLQFNESIDPTTFTLADVDAFTGPRGDLAASSVAPVAGINNTQFVAAFAAQSTPGTYSLTVGPDIEDTARNALDQNGDGLNGSKNDLFTATGILSSTTVPTVPPAVPPTVPPASPPIVPPPPPPPPPPALSNTPPQISDVANQTVALNGNTGPLTFTVFDAQTAATGLTVTATSSNPAFVAASGVTLLGTGQDRTIAVTPLAGLTGSATITLTVTDAGGLTATDSFSVSVLPAVPPVTLGSTDPRILVTPTELSDMRQKAAANTPQWQAFKARLDANLTQLVSGYYQGSGLEWIADYALGYRVLEQSDPTTAAKYADKAIGIMKSGLRDYQKGGWETRQFLTRGDGSTATFTLPNADALPATVHVYVGNVTTKAVTRGSQSSTDAVDYYSKFLKVSNTPDGPADYAEGLSWQHTGNQDQNAIAWLLGSLVPIAGSTYYVTETSAYAASPVAFTLTGNTITLNTAPTSNQAVFVEYIYGTHAADGSTLAYQQTSAGDGGFNSIYIDTTYTSRNLGKYIAMGYDWLNDYAGFTPALRSETANLLVRWSDYIRDNGYYANSPASNYGAGGYVSRMFTALALSGGRDSNGDRLINEMTAYRQNNLVPLLQNPTTSLDGGFWSEGWNYGNLATRNVLLAGLAYESAGLGAADAERNWASEAITELVSSQPTRDTVYDGGDGYAYPAPFPSKDLFYILAAADTDPVTQKYANYIIQNYSSANTDDFQDLMYRDPSAAAAFWPDLPLQYRAAGTGLVTARADWTYNSTWVSFQLGNLLPADHQTYTPGQVQIQRGADALLVNANAIGENQNLSTESSFGNLIAIDDNGDGAQNYRWNIGVWYGSPGVVTTAYEATGGYVYVAGDYHAAYSLNTAPGAGGPASELTRQVVYLRPDFVLVHDRATTTKDTYPKQLQWHLLNAPTVSGNSWVEAVGGSKLFGQTFSSQPITTTAQPAVDNNATVYRVATNNAAPTQKVRYTTALQTAPSSAAGMVATQQVTSSDGRMEGVQMANQVVLFGTDGAINPTTGITYSATGSASLSHLLTDLQPGRSYQVTVNGSPVGTLTASGQGTLSFTTTTTGALTIQVS